LGKNWILLIIPIYAKVSFKISFYNFKILLNDVLHPLHALSGEKDEQKAIEKLACEWVLLTTTDVSEVSIEHRLYHHWY
jgi:hypothetical protein